MLAGLDPARFWDLTPRLLFLELDGAAQREKRARELVWMGAMMPYLEKTPTLEQFIGEKPNPAERAQRFHAEWDKIDRALARRAGP